MKIKKFVKYFIPVFVWMGVIFSFSAYPTKTAGGFYWFDFLIKKSAHVVEYGILTALTYRALKNYGINIKNSALFAILISIMYGATDEFHQSFTPGREPKIRDVFFDTIGAVFAIYAVWNWVSKYPKIKNIVRKFELI